MTFSIAPKPHITAYITSIVLLLYLTGCRPPAPPADTAPPSVTTNNPNTALPAAPVAPVPTNCPALPPENTPEIKTLKRDFIVVLIDPGAPIAGLTVENQPVNSVLEFMESIINRAAEPGDKYAALYLGNQARNFDNALVLEVQAPRIFAIEIPPTPIAQPTTPTPDKPTPINTPESKSTPTHQELEAAGFPVKADHKKQREQFNEQATATQKAYSSAATSTQAAYSESATLAAENNRLIEHENECAKQAWATAWGGTEASYTATIESNAATFKAAVEAARLTHAAQLPLTVTAQVAKLLTAIPPVTPTAPPPLITFERAMSSSDVYDGLHNASALFKDECKNYDRCILVIFDQMVDWRDKQPKILIDLKGVVITAIFPQCQSEATPKCSDLANKWSKELTALGSPELTHYIQKNAEEKLLQLLNADLYP